MRAADGADGPLYCCTGCRLAAAVAGGRGGQGLIEARLLLSAFLSMGVMTISLVLYGETVYDAADEPGMRAIREVGRAGLALFALPVLLLLAPPLLQGAWHDIRARRIRMDGLIVIAVLAAYGLSVAHTITGTGDVWFDTATMVLVLVTFGRRLEAHARTHGRDAADALLACLPERAHRETAAGAEDVRPDALAAGDVVRVLPGEAVPADICVIEGTGEASAAHITGESAPVPVGPGDLLPAGATNGGSVLRARVERPALQGSLGRIHDLLRAPLSATAAMRAADRLAGWLALLAIALAVGGGARSWSLHDAGTGLRTSLAVLLVACPCALGLATPLAYRAMRAALARHGVLVRDPAVLEAAVDITDVLLDKTGTLTDPDATHVAGAVGAEPARERLLALVAHSGHALGRGLPRGALVPTDVRIVPGAGVEGAFDGVACRAGRPGWLGDVAWDDDVAAECARRSGDGSTLVAYEESGRVRALAALEHRVRDGAREAVQALRAVGLAVEVLSGDRQEAAERLSAELGVVARGGLMPEDKLARVRDLHAARRKVLFAGDGVNDAPSLRAADVGVSIGSGTALARDQARAEVVSGDLRALPAMLAGAHTLRRTVRANLATCVVYNGVALSLAAAGLLHPLIAVVAMIVSSLAVSARSYRLLAWNAEPIL